MNAHQPLSTAGREALKIAARGFPVFPCHHKLQDPKKPCKAPLTAHGHRGATTDATQIETWWRRWPDALIGVPTGSRNGFWVLDLDLDVARGINGLEALEQLQNDNERLPVTVTSRTPRGGRHLFFAWSPERPVTNSRGNLPRGIDARGEGGYVIVAPSRRDDGAAYKWEHPPGSVEPATAPEWLYALLVRAQGKTALGRNERAHTLAGASPREAAYARQALENVAAEIARAPEGRRNEDLNKAAFKIGQMVVRGWIARGEPERAFLAAAHACKLSEDDGLTSVLKTIESGLTAGQQSPHADLEDQVGVGRSRPDLASCCERGVSFDDFYAHMPSHTYIFAPSREMWPAASVNARLPPVELEALNEAGDEHAKERANTISASAWLDQNRPVEQVTWSPGHPLVIENRLIADGGWIERPGCRVFNLYRPPALVPKAGDAAPWLDHVHRIYPDDAQHMIAWLAHRVQRPGEKVNHALVLGGHQGVGKDTLLEPVKRAIGPWNFSEVSPQHLLGRFNSYLKSVILRVNEARDLGDMDRFAFYDHMKGYLASPPDVLRVDEKNLREYSVPNVCGVVITTNHKSDGIYLPADDRRHYIAWSKASKADFDESYFRDLYRWFDQGGDAEVAYHLGNLDLSTFGAKDPPPKTPAFWDIVNASRVPEDAELADILEKLGQPNTVTIADLIESASTDFAEWLKDRKNSRRIPHRLEDAGYTQARNPDAADALWKVGGRRQVIYANATLPLQQRVRAAADHNDGGCRRLKRLDLSAGQRSQ